jgi:hypothetical protein
VPGSAAISLPSLGYGLSPTELAYRKRATSQRQASIWNEKLADDPKYGPSSGFIVGIADQPEDGRWPLIWVRQDEVTRGVGIVRHVVLCDRRDDQGRYYEEASLLAEGGIRITGDDSGSKVEEFFGPGLSDYEWFYEVPPERVPDLLSVLGGSATDDVLTLLAVYYERHGGAALDQLLRSEQVDAQFHSFNS